MRKRWKEALEIEKRKRERARKARVEANQKALKAQRAQIEALERERNSANRANIRPIDPEFDDGGIPVWSSSTSGGHMVSAEPLEYERPQRPPASPPNPPRSAAMRDPEYTRGADQADRMKFVAEWCAWWYRIGRAQYLKRERKK